MPFTKNDISRGRQFNLITKKKLIVAATSIVQYNSYVTAYLLRLTALGYTAPSAATLAAMNTFTSAISVPMSKLDIMYIKALNNTALGNAATINLINPSTFQMSRVNSPAQLVSGMQGDAATSYGNTNYNPATQGINYLLDAATRFAYVYTIGSNTAIDGLTIAAVNRMLSTSVAGHRINTTNNLSSAVDLTGIGYKAMTRSSSTVVDVYKDLTKSSRTATSTALVSETQLIGRSVSDFSSHVFSLYGMGGILTEAEHNLIRNSFVTYLAALGL